jgi:carboxylesterase type B
LYPKASYASNLERYRTMLTDMRYACPAFALAKTNRRSYLYEFTYESLHGGFALGPTHAAELTFLFDHPEGIRGSDPVLTGTDEAMSEQLQASWVAFARNGTPGRPSTWRRHADGGRFTQLDKSFTLARGFRAGRCRTVNDLAKPVD